VCHVSLPSSYRSRRGHIHLPRVLPLVGCRSKTPTHGETPSGRGLLQWRSTASIRAAAAGARLGSGELQAALHMQGPGRGSATARARAASSSALYRARRLALACRAQTPRGDGLAMPRRDCRASMRFGRADGWARAGAGRAHGLDPAR
jgi:hypothetical protein